ncbi:serine/threonine-protein phosphatase [Leptospira levettii]|uniref:PP2C family protein-serine/threonine phosphatase n=1 Tax=Leptospira levettii TaxID=2023178 RepID=UPI00108424F0|nr:serine/threonine-protein phosphatase [Leptospira levettii]TGM34737.1 serine/threonine-protein phosphatase [Leptospira levettii]TGM68813.1 serine/threonine-protein phosphatase [Leptospira levettii]TGM75643.1 serine/threonine-protein phosphatase [Leptospira levettii]TGM91936.1 serine/threonine-protein phosphatase [Leptospira levettii]
MRILSFFFPIFFSTIFSLVAEPVSISADTIVSLSENWTFTTNEITRPITVGKGLSSQGFLPPVHGYYETTFTFKPNKKPLGIYLDRVQEIDTLVVNGITLGQTGKILPDGSYFPNWYYKRLYYIPNEVLKENSQNQLKIEIHFRNQTFQGGIFRRIPVMGNYDKLQELILLEDGRDFCFIMLFFGIGAYQIFSILLKRQAKTNFYLLLSTLFFVMWRLPLLNISYTYTDLSFFFWLKLFFTSQSLLPVSIFLFSYSLFQNKLYLKERLLVIFLISIAFIQTWDIELPTRILLLRIWEFTLLLVVFFVLRAVIRAARAKKTEAYFLSVGFVCICIGATFDIIIDVTSGKNIYLTQYGFLILMILSGVAISYRNAKNESELSILTKDLEQRVRERTIELREKNQDLEQDLFFASQLQSYLLPKNHPKTEGIRIHTTYLPMRQVGGDLYDWVELDENRLILLIADVAGHGVPAAFVSSMVKVQFRESTKSIHSPKLILEHMNQALTSLVSRYFITACCALVDTKENTIIFSTAGHPNPILYNKIRKSFEFMNIKGPIIGWKESFTFTEWKHQIQKGDRYFFFTDGVTEARAENKLFGESKILDLLEKGKNKDIKSLSQEIVVQITKYSDAELKDDVTFFFVDII